MRAARGDALDRYGINFGYFLADTGEPDHFGTFLPMQNCKSVSHVRKKLQKHCARHIRAMPLESITVLKINVWSMLSNCVLSAQNNTIFVALNIYFDSINLSSATT